jgi:hypothetical protein
MSHSFVFEGRNTFPNLILLVLSALDQYGRSPFRSGNNYKFSTIQTVFLENMRETISFDIPQGTVLRKES